MPIRKSVSRKQQSFQYAQLQERRLLAVASPIADDIVVERYVFYNDSSFDGNNIVANAADDNAIATNKSALLPGETATYDNITNFTQGINGIIIDADLPNAAAFSANDIVLSTGAGDQLSDFTVLGVAHQVSVRAGEGVNGSDRITVTLPNGSVTNEFLQVRILANADTGLTADDVFYFGNVVGETGNSLTDTFVNAGDVSAVRANLSGLFSETVDNNFDVNRDGFVNAGDISAIRANLTGLADVPLITTPAEPTPTDPVFNGTEFFVTSAAEIEDALEDAVAGDIITLRNGVYTNQQIQFNGFGTEDAPITLRAETPGGVILNGSSSINISGDWLVVEGLNFDGGALESGDHIVEFRGANGEATNSRFTNSQIVNYNPPNVDTRYFWVSLYGQNNRVDNNTFEGQNHSGVTVVVWRNNTDPDFHLIDNNYFLDRPESNQNGFEAIRIGTSDESLSDSFTTVEHNVFERIDGEIEIISVKSGSNTLRYNTFIESAGTLTLRQGNNSLVEGNVFLGNGRDRSGGVRIIGEGHTVVNNYFEGLDGRAGGAISISAGVVNTPLNGHAQVRNVTIAHNTIVDVNGSAIFFSEGLGNDNGAGPRFLLAENVTIANNLIFTGQDPLFGGDEGSNFSYEGNIVFGESLGTTTGQSGITVANPLLARGADGLLRLTANSPAINAAQGDYSSSTGNIDIDGQQRIGVADVGADEFAAAVVETLAPLTGADVGHCFLDVPPDNGGGDNGGGGGDTGGGSGTNVSGGLILEANDFTSALDPNGDGDTFTVVQNSDALGGSVVVAPEGPRVNLPGTQDAVLTFDVQFEEVGTYTAYYRGRGLNGSSDSIYTPTDFFTDPTENESLSNDGNFRWETGDTFEITAADLDTVFEFRIGKREADAELDVFVFHLDGDLSDSELDNLFN